jgi:hypothetical protein
VGSPPANGGSRTAAMPPTAPSVPARRAQRAFPSRARAHCSPPPAPAPSRSGMPTGTGGSSRSAGCAATTRPTITPSSPPRQSSSGHPPAQRL